MNTPLILIAEDTPDILMVLIELLEMEGFRVHTASDGQAAWDYLINCHRCPDLVITDIMMPRLNGIDLVELIRDSEKFKDLPVAIYSASCQYKQVATDLNSKFILKPFDMPQILELVKGCLYKEEL